MGPREGQKPRSKGSPWPPLLHASSGHRPESTVLQLVSARPRCPLLRPLSQMGRQTPSLPVCPAASLKTNGRRRQGNQTQRQSAPSVKDTGKVGVKGVEKLQRSPPEVPPQLGRGVGGRTPIWGGVGLVEQWLWGAVWPYTGHNPQGKYPQGGESSLGPPSWTGRSQVHFSWDIPHTCSAETRNS